ncbi:helix-turn-helix domain-containing protein [Geodermatophilus sp. CPCC 206100]|uniref:helix-turn-helix domain-containing protein n=1 Tax=Geodermatophilus sp. CPCC 206100 TaxID=3020054 RepID=UPI003AFFBE79
MDFAFTERRPAGRLGRHVASLWHARGQIPYRRERIAPTGSTVAGIVLGPPIRQTPDGGPAFLAVTGFLIGPHDRPIVNEPTADTHCVGIVTTPIGCRAVLGLDPAPLRGRVADLLARWPAARALHAELLASGADGAEALNRTEAVLATGLDESDRGLDRVAAAVAALEADPARPVGDLAAGLGVSHGHLDREFTRVVGLSPRTLARVLRVRRLLEQVDVRDRVAWTRLAAELGWYDQAHRIRDVVRHTGVPPSAYVAAQRRFLQPGEEAPGFVPEPG